MANRRMFARSVTSSGRFLRLSAQARALYFDLGMEADDDGFVEAFVRLRATGAEEVHLFELEQRGFITIKDREDLVVHISDWSVNNLVRRDRYIPSVYRSRFPDCVGEGPVDAPEIQEAAPEALCQPVGNQVETKGQPEGVFLGDSRLTQVRLGQDRLDQDRLDQDNLVQENTGKTRLEKERKEKRPGAREEQGSPDAQNPDDFETEFLKKREKSIDFLLKSKHFSDCRGSCHPAPSG